MALSAELLRELDEERRRGREVVDEDADVLHRLDRRPVLRKAHRPVFD